MPLPSCVRPRAFSMRWKRSKSRGHFRRRDARARVAHFQHDPVAGRPQRDGDLAVEGELECVGQQVEDDLLPHVPVHVRGLGLRLAFHDQPKPRTLRRRAEYARELRRECRKVRRPVAGARAARLDAREVEQRVHEAQQPHPVAAGDFDLGLRIGTHVLPAIDEEVLERPEHQRERRAKFVAYVREERGLGAVDLRERLCALPFLRVCARVGKAVGELCREQAEEVPVRRVERKARADARDEKARGFMRLGGRDRDDDRRVRRVRPRSGRHAAELPRDVLDDDEAFRAPGFLERPPAVLPASERDRGRRNRVPGGHADAPGQRCLLAVLVDQVDERIGHVERVGLQRFSGDGAGLFRCLAVACPCADVAQRRDPSLGIDLAARLDHGGNDAADAAGHGVVRDRAVSDGEVAFLHESVAVDLEDEILVPVGRAAVVRRLDAGLQDVPDLGPGSRGTAGRAPTDAWTPTPGCTRRCRCSRSPVPTRAGAETGWRAGS